MAAYLKRLLSELKFFKFRIELLDFFKVQSLVIVKLAKDFLCLKYNLELCFSDKYSMDIFIDKICLG